MQNLIAFFQIKKKESNRSKSSRKKWLPIFKKKKKKILMQTSFKFKIALRSTNRRYIQ